LIKEKSMSASNHTISEPAERVLVIERVFDAPRHLVFKAWTEPERLMRWWGPRGFTMTYCKMDLRPGGAYRFEMRSVEGVEHRSQGNFREIVAPERLVLEGAWIDDQGKAGHETVVTLTFADLGEKTRLTLHQALFESVEARDSHNGGWSSSMECLAEYLAGA
jgi:uncharacterized protein YndB with AHSA1/START domain